MIIGAAALSLSALVGCSAIDDTRAGAGIIASDAFSAVALERLVGELKDRTTVLDARSTYDPFGELGPVGTIAVTVAGDTDGDRMARVILECFDALTSSSFQDTALTLEIVGQTDRGRFRQTGFDMEPRVLEDEVALWQRQSETTALALDLTIGQGDGSELYSIALASDEPATASAFARGDVDLEGGTRGLTSDRRLTGPGLDVYGALASRNVFALVDELATEFPVLDVTRGEDSSGTASLSGSMVWARTTSTTSTANLMTYLPSGVAIGNSHDFRSQLGVLSVALDSGIPDVGIVYMGSTRSGAIHLGSCGTEPGTQEGDLALLDAVADAGITLPPTAGPGLCP
ncbi:MAG: hypothetical protein RI885_264 [Actinomycetota bacterium]|jgi:hypothetical protein